MSNFMRIRSGIHLGSLSVEPSGSEGMIYFNTTTKKFRRHDGSSWKDIGSGGGTGTGDDLGTLTFKASFNETFLETPSESNAAVDYSVGKTDSNLYNAAYQYLRLSYDASKTVTGTGTAMTLSGAPSFTVKVGDVLVVGTQARRITTVTTQTQYVIESAFSSNPAASACNVSQAIYSKDLNNYSGDGLAPSAAFNTSISQILLTYEDTTAAGDVIFDANTTPVIAYSASSDGLTYSPITSRATLLNDTSYMLDLPSTGTNLYLRFFSSASSGSGSVNLLKYKVFFHREIAYQDGTLLKQSYCLTNGAGTEINCSTPYTLLGKTRVQLTWTYPLNVNSTPVATPNGALTVYLNGQKIPRYVDSIITPDGYYKEISENIIELDSDYSSLAFSLEVQQTVAVVDTTETNSTAIAYSQEIQNLAFQGFVNTSNYIQPTTTTGTPATGYFHSLITNRAPIVDLNQDLKPRMGIERITTQAIYLLPNEFGANNEPVYGSVNDTTNRIRFVGGGWINLNDSNGARPYITGSTTTEYIEITFYGTGLNILTVAYNTAVDIRATVDGGTEGGNLLLGASYSNILNGRNYSWNQAVVAASNLALGVHTIKIRKAGTGVNADLNVYGFEIINQSSTITVNPGVSYVGGKKLITSAQQSLSYNSSFESGTLGTKGGRVVVYQKADGTIAKSVQPTDATRLVTTLANHQNEEIAKKIYFREFGAGRWNATYANQDDFSLMTGTSRSAAYTLDDGTTTLVATNTTTGSFSNYEGVGISAANGGTLTFTFVGTGLDVFVVDGATGGSDNYTFSIDNFGTYSWPYTAGTTGLKLVKIASGLPYGTHMVTFTRVSAATFVPFIVAFNIYQPKKPSIPAGAVELADYNIMADYSYGGSPAMVIGSSGMLYKSETREMIYVGTWNTPVLNTASIDGWQISSTTSGSYLQYTFFGTGCEIYAGGTGTTGVTINIDGSNYTGSATAFGGTWTPGTSIWSNIPSVSRLAISGLTLGLHTIKITKNDVQSFSTYGISVITPIHSYKSNLYEDLQNTLSIGSNAISDNRKTTIIKEGLSPTKSWSQAVGVTSNPTTTSTVFVPMPDMSCTIKTGADGKPSTLRISYHVDVYGSAIGQNLAFQVNIDGFTATILKDASVYNATSAIILSDVIRLPVNPGFHKVDLFWLTNSGTLTANATRRVLLVEEV